VHLGGASGGDDLFGQLHASLRRYVRKHHGGAAASFASAALWTGALLRYLAALITPGDSGRRRRLRYGSALARRKCWRLLADRDEGVKTSGDGSKRLSLLIWSKSRSKLQIPASPPS